MDSHFYVALIHALTGVIDNFQTFSGVAMPCREACPDMRQTRWSNAACFLNAAVIKCTPGKRRAAIGRSDLQEAASRHSAGVLAFQYVDARFGVDHRRLSGGTGVA